MNVISQRGLKKLAAKAPASIEELAVWYKRARAAEWHSLADVRADFPSADLVGNVLVFNIRHNHYRLIVTVVFRTKLMFVKALLTQD